MFGGMVIVPVTSDVTGSVEHTVPPNKLLPTGDGDVQVPKLHHRPSL